MFKIIVMLFMLTSTVAYAENWYTVTDSSSGLRLVADIDSVVVDKYKTTSGAESVRIYGVMQYVGDDTPPFTSIIDVTECFAKQRGTMVVVFQDKTSKVYFWDGKGNKMYDAQGQFLCGFAIGLRDKAESREQQGSTTPNTTPKSATF